MSVRVARCRCGQLTATCTGEPVRVSVCHCTDCQRRTGGPFSAQARFPRDAVVIDGASRPWTQAGDSGRSATFHWCGRCGCTVFYVNEGMDSVAIPLGAFDVAEMPAPTISVFEERRHRWVSIEGEGITRWA